MITRDEFCKKCGQKINIKSIPFLPKEYILLDDGAYCMECGKSEVLKRRAKK